MKSDGEMAMKAEIRQVPCQPSNHASAAQRKSGQLHQARWDGHPRWRISEESLQVDIEIRTSPGPRKGSVNLLAGRGFRNGFEASNDGEEDRGEDGRAVTEAEVHDRRRASEEPHAQADSALVGAESEFPSPAVAEETQGSVIAVRVGSLEGQGFVRSGCPHQEFRRFPS